MKKFNGSRVANTVVVFAIAIVPLLYAGLFTLAYQNPTNRLETINAAVVNEDQTYTGELVTGSTETFNLGDELEDTLVHPTEDLDVGFTWKPMSASEAEAKMACEEIRAILYIPKDFSQHVTQIGTQDRAQAATQELRLVTDDGINYLTGTMAKTVATTMSNRLDERGASTLTDHLLLSISTVREGMGHAADGASQLSQGSDTLTVGVTDLASGAVTLRSGLTTLADGTSQASEGSSKLSDGLTQLSSGAADAQAGASTLSDGASRLASGTSELNAKTGPLAQGVSRLNSGGQGLASGIDQYTAGVHRLSEGLNTAGSAPMSLKDGAATLATGLDQLKAALSSLDTSGITAAVAGSGKLKDGVASYTGAVDQLAAACKAAGDASLTCQTLQVLSSKSEALTTGAGELNAGLSAGAAKLSQLSALPGSVDRLATGAHSVSDGVNAAAQGAQQLDSKSAELSAGARDLSTGLSTLNGQIPALTSGVSALDDGAHQLSGGASDLSSGLGRLARGSQSASDNAAVLSAGLDKLAGGANSAAEGSAKLSDGLAMARDGSAKLSEGASTLSSKLSEGAAKIPQMSDADRQHVAEISGKVARVTDVRDNPVVNNGAGFTPMFMSLALWIGTIALFLVLPALDKREKGERWWRAATRPAVTATLLAVLQAVVMMVVVNAVGELHAANVAGLCAIAILASVSYMAVNQACVAALAFRGRFVSIILLCLQITSMGATFPIETTPAFFQWIHPYLPMSYTQLAFRKFISGAPGVDGIVGKTVAILLIWLVISAIITLVSAKLRNGRKPLPADNALAPTAH